MHQRVSKPINVISPPPGQVLQEKRSRQGAHYTYNNMLAKAHAGRVHTQDCGDAVEAGVVEKLLPAVEWHVGIVVALNGRAGVVHLHELLCSGDRLLGRDVGVIESTLWSTLFGHSNSGLFLAVSKHLQHAEKPQDTNQVEKKIQKHRVKKKWSLRCRRCRSYCARWFPEDTHEHP